ncbi:cysteine desufuration protein SufE [Fischerella thermalis CCMEE 5198]|uniref:SufE family protein n=1 Tax=Fischerella thermalis TaxID=372787 RepID=UPI000C80390B|nr:cysteine desulfuration protein SufE [Fischerella thermalis CCMEE 5196]PMB24309.1 cysteine desufuration protein SufE [Fischerella thermalis CCMEE 5198]
MPPVSQPLPASLERIVQRFQQITEPKRWYEYLLRFAKRVPELSEAEQVAANKVPGCVSQVYITTEVHDDSVTFRGTSDAQITKGLVGLLVEGLNGLTPNEILQLAPDFIQQTGFDVSLIHATQGGNCTDCQCFFTPLKKTEF